MSSAATSWKSSRTATRSSTIVTSQIPVDHWYDMIGNPTIADAILDRLVHNAYRVELSGESLRKQRTAPSNETTLA
ncbi:ATP-binding protein [Mesorhizobium sp. M0118]